MITNSLCVSCGGSLSPHSNYRFKTSHFRHVYAGDQLLVCAKCDLVQTDMARIDEPLLSNYYARQYRASGITGNGVPQQRLYRARARALAGLVERHATGSIEKVFEIGAGYGYNLLGMSERYPKASLFTDEVDATIAWSDKIKRSTLTGPYDVVIASHVLEHFTSPVEILRRAVDSLAPSGLLVIEVPHETSIWIEAQPFHEPHVTFFTEDSLRVLLSRFPINLLEIFGAGPSIRPLTTVGRIHRVLRSGVSRVPGARKLLNSVLALAAPPDPDYSIPNPNGLFVRAILRKT
jgi:SAM-dependent methyltransferase